MAFLGIDPRTYELAAFTQLRGLKGLNAEWGKIVSVAEAIIARAEDTPREKIAELRAANAINIIASCRSLDSCRQKQSKLEEPNRRLLALEAAVAYSMTGNFSSAQTIIASQLDEGSAESSPDFRIQFACILAAASASSKITGNLLSIARGKITPNERLFLENLLNLLDKGGESALKNIIETWVRVVIESTDDQFKSSLLRGVRTILYQIGDLSVKNLLGPFDKILPDGYADALCKSGFELFLPSQLTALAIDNFLGSKENALISMPTS